jgi:hypothetical protein
MLKEINTKNIQFTIVKQNRNRRIKLNYRCIL